MGIRLNKYISESGICSRREADRFIERGVVFVNGVKAGIGRQVTPRDTVMVNGMIIEPKNEEEAVYLAFNKPVGITCTTEPGRNNIVDYIGYSKRIFPIGRLDKDSQGLIFLTSNGDIVNKILRAGNNHEKEYVVTVNKPITDHFIEGMGNGVSIMGVNTKKCFVQKEAPFVFRIILIQGLNRQIRRMCEHFGYEVTRLERQRIMNISLKGLPLGEWRELTPAEISGINEMIKHSVSTEEASTKRNQPGRQKPKPGSTRPANGPGHKQGEKQGDKPFKKNFEGDKKPFKKHKPGGGSGNARPGKSSSFGSGKPRSGSGKSSFGGGGKNSGGRKSGGGRRSR